MSANIFTKITIRTMEMMCWFLGSRNPMIWKRFGRILDWRWNRKKYIFYTAHKIYQTLGKNKALPFLFFHAVAACDQVSFMSFNSRKTVWNIWEVCDEAAWIFMKLSNQPILEEIRESMQIINRFTGLSYDKLSNILWTKECKRKLICKGRQIDKIPPTEAAYWKYTCWST